MSIISRNDALADLRNEFKVWPILTGDLVSHKGHHFTRVQFESEVPNRRAVDGATTGRVIDPGGVNHPKHYNVHPSGVECIDVIEHMSLNVGNAVKYLWRADEKDSPIQDLEKAVWYIQREIAKRKKGGV